MPSSSATDPPTDCQGDAQGAARARLSSILSDLSRYQWRIVCAARQISKESREEYIAELPVDALTEDALRSWEACIESFRNVVEGGGDVHTVKRTKREHTTSPQPIIVPELFQSGWFAAHLCPFLTTGNASQMRAAAPLLCSFVASYRWDDLSCPVPVEHMHLWRKCFPAACGAHVVLPALSHPLITSLEAVTAPHDAIFERFKGLRRLTVEGAEGYAISDAAFAHLAGVVELNMPAWGNISLLTDAGLKHLAGVRKLDFAGTYSLHLTSVGFRHLAGIQQLQLVAGVHDDTFNFLWRMTDGALCHLRGIRQLVLHDSWIEGAIPTGIGAAAASTGITDAGFVHLQGIQELTLMNKFDSFTSAAFSQLRGISSLYLGYDGSSFVTDDTMKYFAGIESLKVEEASSVTDAGLRHLAGIKTLHIPYCPQLTGTGFAHLAGIRDLDISDCPLVTDTAFQYLRGIRTLSMSACLLVTDAAFAHLGGIQTLNMRGCSQEAITDEAFTNLAGIRSLNMSCCNQTTITSAALHHLAGIQHLDMEGCTFEVDTDTFARLRSLPSLKLRGASLTTLLAALQVFQGNADVERSLWGALTVNASLRRIIAANQWGQAHDEFAPFYDLATAKSLMPMLRTGLHDLHGEGIPAVAVVLAAQFVVHVARRPSERAQLYAQGVVQVLIACIREQSWGPALRGLCSALEVLCEYPGFAAQVVRAGGIPVLARVFSRVDEEPLTEFTSRGRGDIVVATCRTLCWVLLYCPDAGTVLADLDFLSPLLNTRDMQRVVPNFRSSGIFGARHSVAALGLITALVRALAASGTNSHVKFLDSILQPESVHRLLLSLAGAETESELQDMCKRLQELVTWGSDVASTPSPATSIIVKLWKLHPEYIDVCQDACYALHRCACSSKSSASEATAHLHALVAAGSIPCLVNAVQVRGVQTHSVESVHMLPVQVGLLWRISCDSEAYCNMVRDAGAVAVLQACRDALPHNAKCKKLAMLITFLEEAGEEDLS